jgi:hypothetical protein
VSAPNPVDNEELYDAIVLGGQRSPGVVALSGHDRVIGWDVKKGAGQSGATTTRTSEDPAEVTCSFYLVKDDAQGIDDFAQWPAFLALAKSTVAGAKPKALDIYHPDLAENDIKSVVLKKVGGVVHDGMGGQTRTLVFLEYRPPKPKGGTPKASGTKKPKENDPNAEALAELARLTKQYQDTPWG